MSVTKWSLTGGGRLREVVAMRDLTVCIKRLSGHHYFFSVFGSTIKIKGSFFSYSVREAMKLITNLFISSFFS